MSHLKKTLSLVLLSVLITTAGIYLKTASDNMPNLLTALHSPLKPIAFRLHLLLGADSDEQTSHGQTALMEASSLCSLKYVKLLLKAGSNPNIKNVHGETAIMQIGFNGSGDSYLIANELIMAGADLNAVSDNGMTALVNATKLGDVRLIKLIKEALSEESTVSDP
ncbi:ankyrin repeat domain-containing protein [Gynuella sunshinyii]|nr:ankyrin repeat domain-containing protein [Gynuella sunshinyii]